MCERAGEPHESKTEKGLRRALKRAQEGGRSGPELKHTPKKTLDTERGLKCESPEPAEDNHERGSPNRRLSAKGKQGGKSEIRGKLSVRNKREKGVGAKKKWAGLPNQK